MSSLPDRVPEGRIRLTYAEYVELPNDGRRYEILDGELAVTPAPVPRHQAVSRNLQRILDRYITEHRLGQLFNAPIDVILSDTTIVQPDLLVLGTDRGHFITERAVEGPPTLMVEILSPSSVRQDRITKAALYARFGVPHYWLLDPSARTLEMHELTGDAYRLIAAGRDSDRMRCGLFPGLEIDLAAVWA
jgi:Uma2 family endonuclease